MTKKKALAQSGLEKCEQALAGHEHIHAANCGHKNYVHAGHICYEHDGHYHYMHNGHAHECPGPFAKVGAPTNQNAKPIAKPNAKPGVVVNLNEVRKKKQK